MDINDFTIPTIKKHKGKFTCKHLEEGVVKPEAEPLVVELVHALNETRSCCPLLHRSWPYVVLGILFIISIVIMFFIHGSYFLLAIPLAILLTMLVGSVVSYSMTYKRNKTILLITEEYRAKLAQHYILVDNYNIRAYEYYHRVYNAYYDHGYMIKLVPLELLNQRVEFNNADINFRQEQQALLEQAQLNREIPIYDVNQPELRRYETDEEDGNRTR